MGITMRIVWMVLAMVMALATATTGLSLDLAAKKDGVKVLSEPSKSAASVSVLKKGEALKSLNRKGMFWEVETAQGKKGFVSVMDVSRKAGGSDPSLAKAIRSVAQEGRAADSATDSARSRSAVMGVRGLDDSQETAFAGNVKPNLRMVYSMEDRVVPADSVDHIAGLVAKEVEARASKTD